jgi:hypothetical protein
MRAPTAHRDVGAFFMLMNMLVADTLARLRGTPRVITDLN